jgi:iron complex transport system substrate-binding protein
MRFRTKSLLLAGIVAACTTKEASPVRTLAVDDFGDTVRVSGTPSRIVSMNPATTELLFAIGAGPRLVGRTRWDLYPDSAALVPDLGDGIKPNVEAILAARPDLVVLYTGESNRPAAEALRNAGVPTVSLKIDRIDDFSRALEILGSVAGERERARVVNDSVRATLERVRARAAGLARPTVFWPLWENPLLAVGRDSYLSELVAIAGGRNVYDSLAGPSPSVSMEDVVRRDPDVILTGPATAPRLRADAAWQGLRAVKNDRVLVVDTNLVLRPSLRLGEAAVSLFKLLHPGQDR